MLDVKIQMYSTNRNHFYNDSMLKLFKDYDFLLCTMLGLVVASLLSGCGDPLLKDPALTSSNASREDVTFIDLPANAQEIQYWDDGKEMSVVFRVSEAEFREQFTGVSFEEISEPVFYAYTGYGDPSVHMTDPKWKLNEATNGIVYEWLEREKGGEKYV